MSTMDQARLCWLLGDKTPKRRATKAEYLIAREFAFKAWQISPVLVPRILKWAGDRARPEESDALEALATATSALGAVQWALCQRVVSGLSRAGIPYCLLKGSAVRIAAYDDPRTRCGLDIDIGVPAAHLAHAEQVIAGEGFVAGSLVDDGRHFRTVDPQERIRVEEQHYELACLVRRQRVLGVRPDVRAAIERSIPVLRPWHLLDGELGCYVTLDVHHGICLDIPVDEMVASSRSVPVGEGTAVRVPSTAWMLFHVIFKLYWEGVHNYRKGAYQYADLIRLLARAQDQELDDLISLLDKFSLAIAGHYTLRRVPDDFGIPLPPRLDKFIEETRLSPVDLFPSDVNDMGDMWPKLWGHL
jgi:hypothetical protein